MCVNIGSNFLHFWYLKVLRFFKAGFFRALAILPGPFGRGGVGGRKVGVEWGFQQAT